MTRSRARGVLVSSLLVVGVAFGLVGCAAQRHWTKPGVLEADFHRDSYTCARATSGDRFEWRPGALAFSGGPYFGPKVDKELYRACMKAQGYQFVEGGEWEGFRD